MVYHCRKCGKRIDKPSYCRACWEKQRHGVVVELVRRNGRNLEGKGITEAVRKARELRKKNERCITCAHSINIGGDGVACNYLCDAAEHRLPKRPRPSADPWQCIYHSTDIDGVSDLTREEARAMTDGRANPVLDRDTCRLYSSARNAGEAAGVDRKIVSDIAKKTDLQKINEPEGRWRHLWPEELEMLKYVAESGPSGKNSMDGPVQKIDSNGRVVCAYNSVAEAAEREQISYDRVYFRITGRVKKPLPGGFTFRYREEADE